MYFLLALACFRRSVLTRSANSSKGVLSDVGKNTRARSDFKFRSRREGPDQIRSRPLPGRPQNCQVRVGCAVTLATPPCCSSGQSVPFLPTVCTCTGLDCFWCVWCKGEVCPAVVLVGTREGSSKGSIQLLVVCDSLQQGCPAFWCLWVTLEGEE